MKPVKIKRLRDNVKCNEAGIVTLSPVSSWISMGLDNRVILNYGFGADIHIPDGTIAIVVPANDIWKYSLTYSGPFMLTTANIDDFSIAFKADTNVAPRALEKDEVAVSILFFNPGKGLTPIEFETKEVETEKAEDPTEEETITKEAPAAGTAWIPKAKEAKVKPKAEDMPPILEQ